MEVGSLVDAACEQTGLEDFGEGTYREGLDVLVASLRDEADLSELGRVAIGDIITRSLANRLRVTEWTGAHPEVTAAPVQRPIVVLGMPRTGTTLLTELLHRDPANRSLMGWEAQDSVPPPEPGEFAHGPRVEAARAAAGMLDALNPGFRAIHYEAPDGPTECVTLLAQDFKSLLWETIANVPSYGAWLLGCDHHSAYRYHRRVLQLLQSRTPGRWALKTPHHCLALDALTEQYPDAQLVMTHRDPVTVVASLCSLVRSLSGTFSDSDHGAYINDRWTTVAVEIVERVMAWRDAHGDGAFVDVRYDDLVEDPIAVVRTIYARDGSQLTAAAEDAMRRYLEDHPRGEHGSHRYDPAALGLDTATIEARFAEYRRRFLI